ncbi:MAG: TPM domain-containing protein [Microscillaceae bacterium]|nr:TPM domain-containing protein [Microscillaceae bacterium]
MKTFIFTAFFSFWMGISIFTFAQKIPTAPKPIRFVNDYVGLLSKSEIRELEMKLSDYADSTSSEVVIVIIDTLQGYSIENFSLKLARSWGIGQSDKDNGILILMAVKDRSIRIEVGLGIEAYISDEKTKEVIENEIIPYFKKGEFYIGLDISTTQLIELLKGVFTEK